MYACRSEDALIVLNRQTGSWIRSKIARGAASALFWISYRVRRIRWQYFKVNIRNPYTRRVCLIVVWRSAGWCELHGISVATLEMMAVAAYIEEPMRMLASACVKQHLAALRILFDWLVVNRVPPFNPASSVRGTKRAVTLAETPVLFVVDARRLPEGMGLQMPVGLGAAWCPGVQRCVHQGSSGSAWAAWVIIACVQDDASMASHELRWEK